MSTFEKTKTSKKCHASTFEKQNNKKYFLCLLILTATMPPAFTVKMCFINIKFNGKMCFCTIEFNGKMC